MHMLMKKSDFLALVATMKKPTLVRKHIEVFVVDEGSDSVPNFPILVYCASNFREESYFAAHNKINRFRSWMN